MTNNQRIYHKIRHTLILLDKRPYHQHVLNILHQVPKKNKYKKLNQICHLLKQTNILLTLAQTYSLQSFLTLPNGQFSFFKSHINPWHGRHKCLASYLNTKKYLKKKEKKLLIFRSIVGCCVQNKLSTNIGEIYLRCNI